MNPTYTDTKKSYVYEGIVVDATGRRATRKLPSGRSHELIEIQPHQSDQGVWCKWVDVTELYEIHE